MRKLIVFTVLLSATLIFGSCSSDQDAPSDSNNGGNVPPSDANDVQSASISLSKSTLQLPQAKESDEQIIVTSSSEDWKISEAIVWLQATKVDAKTLSIAYDSNFTENSREGKLTVSITDASATLVITQAGISNVPPHISLVESSPIVLPNKSSDTVLNVRLAGADNWSVSEVTDADNLITTLREDVPSNGKLTVSYTQNMTSSARSAEIEIFVVDSSPRISQTIVFTQVAASVFINLVEDSPIVLPNISADTVLNVQLAGADTWSVSELTDAGNLITTLSEDVPSNGKLTVSYTQNMTASPRRAQIRIFIVDSSPLITQTIVFTQVGALAISIAESSPIVLPNKSSTTVLNIQLIDADDWSVTLKSDPDDLIFGFDKDVPSAGKLRVAYNRNRTSSFRRAEIQISTVDFSPRATQTVVFVQAPSDSTPFIALSESRVTLTGAAGSYELGVASSSDEWVFIKQSTSNAFLSDVTMIQSMEKTSSETLTINYSKNSNSNFREVMVKVSIPNTNPLVEDETIFLQGVSTL